MRPTTRRSDVIVQQVGTDFVVYDQLRDTAHALNPVAAHVYRHADGTRDLEALAAAAAGDLGIPCDAAIVEEALEQLARVDLVTDGLAARDGGATDAAADAAAGAGAGDAVGRRDALRRLGLAALPVVTSLVVPAPVLAQSGGGPGSRVPHFAPGGPPFLPPGWGGTPPGKS